MQNNTVCRMTPLPSLAGVPVGRRRTVGLVSLDRLPDTNVAALYAWPVWLANIHRHKLGIIADKR